MLASPVASNEDLLAALSFAKLGLGAKEIYVGGRPDGAADHYLMTADKNPNRKGLELIAAGLGLALRPFAELVKGLETRQVKALLRWAAGPSADEGSRQRSSRAAWTCSWRRPWAVLVGAGHGAAAGHAHGGRGQLRAAGRAHPALPARPTLQGRGDAAVEVAAELGRELGAKEAALAEPARRVPHAGRAVPEFAQFNWDKASPSDREKPGINPPPAGADGRPPGTASSVLRA